MQDTRTFYFIDQIVDSKTNFFLLDENYNILQYKILNKSNASKLHNVYCGVIEKIDYGIESLFVRVEKDIVGFLPFKQLSSVYLNNKSLLKKGSKILVQVIRDSVGSKSLKLTNNIVLSNVLCVFKPFSHEDHGVSSNIKAEQRTLLKSFLKTLSITGQLVLRTAAFDASLEQVQKDCNLLVDAFNDLMQKFKKASNYCVLLQHDELIYLLRGCSSCFVEKIFVKTKFLYEVLKKNSNSALSKLPDIELKNDFAFLNYIEKQLDRLYQKELLLPSNGSIIIEKTEAMVTIDVNSGKSVKGDNMEATAMKINMEAADLIVDQIILRNLGGIIAVDLIDLKCVENVQLVYEKFKKLFKRDRVSVKVFPINDLCVLHISRERKGLSVLDLDYRKCDHCVNGLVFSLNFWENLFLQKLSKFTFNTALIIYISSTLFELVYEKYFEVIKQYSRLKWKIQNIEELKIQQDKGNCHKWD